MGSISRTTIAAVLAITLAMSGCSRSDQAPAPEPHPVQTAEQLKSRLDAAAKIPVPDARDAAMKEVARDAATSSQADLCASAVGKIAAADVRKATADDCAATLAKAGDKPGAAKVTAAAVPH